MVDKLKQLRVAELRREVERHDVSIKSLQLKVKRLEEERERGLNLKEEQTDLPNEPEKGVTGEPQRTSPDEVAGKPVSGEESDDRENRSFNESTSTNQKGENRKEDENKPDLRREPEEPVSELPKAVPVQVVAKSCMKLSETVQWRDVAEPAKLCDSLAESEGTEGKKQSSQMSSAKKRRRRYEKEKELVEEEVSPAIKPIAVKCQPLIEFLEILQSHKYGSVFERRLRSQETEKYKKMIRQHMDLRTVQTRLDKGIYSDSAPRFFRDLLLLFNNAIVFFKKNSSERTAASELRKLVVNEMAKSIRKPVKPDPIQKQPDPFHAQPKKTVPPPIVVCGKHCSTSTKLPTETRGSQLVKPKLETKKPLKAFGIKVEQKVLKKEKSELGQRNSRTSKRKGEIKSDSDDLDSSKVERKQKANKQKTTSFLKKIMQNLSSEEDSSNDDKEEREEKRREERRGDSRREGVWGRGGRENNISKGRRGRPPKKPVSTCPPPPETRGSVAAKGKKRKEGGDSQAAVVVEGGGRSRKRLRK
ncbi:hypothetical protein F0562_001385 [Nyssa sinensis]|uniref:Bromo domain-containing protein n=1 Tax=Nyssa sinensis TaxID=561372 RepID=A0A5J5C6T9_9ASTE|nr:hypothetical protein F0562_001385 [Nyssa sinensis]